MSLAGTKLHLVETFDEVTAFFRWLGNYRGPLGVDTETGGLEFWRQPLRMIQIGNGEEGWALPAVLWFGAAAEALERWPGEIVMHNAKFDLHFLEREGIRVPRHRVHDTNIQAHLTDNVRPKGLKSLAVSLVDPQANLGEKALKAAFSEQGWDWDTVPYDFPPYWEYSALDPVLTCRVQQELAKELQSFHSIYNLELAVQQMTLDMENRGIRVDLDYCERTIQALEGTAGDLQARAQAQWGVENLGSDMQVIRRLREDGVVFTKFTDKGRESLDAEALKGIDHPLADIVEEYRHATKLVGTYFSNYLELEDDEIIHPSINLLGAKTGRMSVSKPSMQNLERSALVRDAFIAREGRTLLLVDYDTIEYRLFAHYANLEEILEAAREGVDLHTVTAQRIYGIDPGQMSIEGGTGVSPGQRGIAKTATYAILYGAGEEAFARQTNLDLPAAQAFLEQYHSQLPEVQEFQQVLMDTAYDRKGEYGKPYIRTGYGRRLFIPPWKGAYVLINYLVQGTAADVLKAQMLELNLRGLDEYLVLPVHDELVFDVPTEDVDEYEHAIVEAMTVPEGQFKCPLTVDVDRVNRWGRKYAKEDE